MPVINVMPAPNAQPVPAQPAACPDATAAPSSLVLSPVPSSESTRAARTRGRVSSRTPDGCLTVAQACAALGLSRKTFDRLLENGTLVRLGLVETNRLTWRRMFVAASIDRVLYQRMRSVRRAS